MMARLHWAWVMLWTTAYHLGWCLRLYPTDPRRIGRWLRRNWIVYRWAAQE